MDWEHRSALLYEGYYIEKLLTRVHDGHKSKIKKSDFYISVTCPRCKNHTLKTIRMDYKTVVGIGCGGCKLKIGRVIFNDGDLKSNYLKGLYPRNFIVSIVDYYDDRGRKIPIHKIYYKYLV